VPDARKTIEPIRGLARYFVPHDGRSSTLDCRGVSRNAPVDVVAPDPGAAPLLPYRHRRRYEDIGAERECIAVIDELAVQPEDYVVDKYGYGAFFRTNLPDLLKAEETDTVVISEPSRRSAWRRPPGNHFTTATGP